jgi:hypothetical protein
MAGRFTLVSGEYISRPIVQTLAVFELAQFYRRIDLDVGIGANTIDAAICQIDRGAEDTIAEIDFGCWTEACHCTRCGKPVCLIGGQSLLTICG